ncbi:glycoside hydrolase family 43 protein [Xylariaceae sp. FL0804]|nr:glycoside hydrolase family 43 protein [Xylariaceae sp. FL0804]
MLLPKSTAAWAVCGGLASVMLARLDMSAISPVAASPTASYGNFTNPVLWEDLADLDIFRVNDTFYYSASTMAYSPGAPILRSYDLVDWEYIGHSVPVLDWGEGYYLRDGQRAYVEGIWASSMRYRASDDTWYWLGCIQSGNTYVYTAPEVAGPWGLHATLDTCFYDAGLLIDDDDTMYVAYGSTQLSVAQLSSNATSIVKTQQIWDSGLDLEGSRMYKHNGSYYILTDHPASQEWVLQAPAPFGNYSIKILVDGLTGPVAPDGGYSHQGGIVDTPAGDWYYMAFQDAYPGGRIPVLAPIAWGADDGFPVLQDVVDGAWPASLPRPLPPAVVAPTLGRDNFSGAALGPAWEWNHNPDTTKFAVGDDDGDGDGGGLTLSTSSVTDDLYQARNTLTHRIHGPLSTATIAMDTTNMTDGDRAGVALFRDQSAWIGVTRDNGTLRVAMTDSLVLNSTTWQTADTGASVATAPLPASAGGEIYLRCTVDIWPGTGRTGNFSYSTDGGATFAGLGTPLTLNDDWTYFIGYRYGIFNYATKALGGSVKVGFFDQTVSA